MILSRPLFQELEKRRTRHLEIAILTATEPCACAVCRDPIRVGENFASINRGAPTHIRCMTRGARS